MTHGNFIRETTFFFTVMDSISNELFPTLLSFFSGVPTVADNGAHQLQVPIVTISLAAISLLTKISLHWRW